MLTTALKTRFKIVTRDEFGAAFNYVRNVSSLVRGATSSFDPETETPSSYFLSEDEISGFAVRNDGELVFVFSLVKGRGDDLVRAAIALGAVYLDCFDGYLPTLYSRLGFRVDCHTPNWRRGGPDVVYMSLPGYGHRHGMPVLP